MIPYRNTLPLSISPDDGQGGGGAFPVIFTEIRGDKLFIFSRCAIQSACHAYAIFVIR